MEEETNNSIVARHDAPERDTTRHSLTTKQASRLFADLQVPRAPRSVQRFCDTEYLDCVRVRGAKGDQYFISRASVEKYAEELRQISAIASIGAEARHDAPVGDTARKSATRPPSTEEQPLTIGKARESDPLDQEAKRLTDENINLRIDNRAKEQVINMLVAERGEAQKQLNDMSYRLGSAESRLAELDAPKVSEDLARHGPPERDTTPTPVIVDPTVPDRSSNADDALPEKPAAPASAQRRSYFARLFR